VAEAAQLTTNHPEVAAQGHQHQQPTNGHLQHRDSRQRTILAAHPLAAGGADLQAVATNGGNAAAVPHRRTSSVETALLWLAGGALEILDQFLGMGHLGVIQRPLLPTSM